MGETVWRDEIDITKGEQGAQRRPTNIPSEETWSLGEWKKKQLD